MAQSIGRFAVDLACHDASCICDGLLESYARCTAIVGRNIDTEPCYVDSRPVVDGDGSQKRRKVFDPVVVDCEQEDVAHDAEDVRKQEELKGVSSDFITEFEAAQM